MPKKSSGEPKKARWTPAEKAAREESKKRSGKKPHRGQADRSSTPTGAGARSHERTPYADRAPRGGDRPERSDRPRDDRPRTGGYVRDDRPRRDEDRTRRVHPPRHVAGNDPWREREDRRERSERRTERPGDRGGYQRRDAGTDRGGFQNRDDRGGYQGRDAGADRGGYQGRSTGADRGGYQGRSTGSDRGGYQNRDSGYQRREERGGFQNRDDRGGYQRRDAGTDRGELQKRDDRAGFQNRDDRGGYQGRSAGSDRAGYQGRNDRAFTAREDRGERGGYQGRDDRGGYQGRSAGSDRAGYQGRDDRGTDPRHGGGFERRERFQPSTGGHHDAHTEAEALRAEADEWTAYKPKAGRSAKVTEDNGFAAMGIPERLVERLARDGITEPFPIQTATIPDAMAGRDVLGRGQTGSGKTLAFGLPTITRLAAEGKAKPKRPRALVLVPTRELAMQVSDALEPLVHVMGLRHKLVAGGLSYEPQISALARGLDLLIATPGRLKDLLDRGAVEFGDIEVAILDEADHMADMGFMTEITAIMDEIPQGGQRLLFSATLDKGIDGLVERYLTDPVTHSTDDAQASVTTMAHHLFLVEPNHKKVLTAELAARPGRTIVFVRTKLGADRIALQLRESGVAAAALHGGLTQGARNRVLGAFRTGTLPVLVATDVAARGIHVDDVSLVLQVDPPADHKDYLHRSGRTARAGEEGAVVTLALPHQKRTMERLLGDAGVETSGVKATPGSAAVAAAGGREPSGVPILESEFRSLVDPPRPQFSRGGRRPGGRQGGGFGGRGERSGHGGPRAGRPRRYAD